MVQWTSSLYNYVATSKFTTEYKARNYFGLPHFLIFDLWETLNYHTESFVLFHTSWQNDMLAINIHFLCDFFLGKHYFTSTQPSEKRQGPWFWAFLTSLFVPKLKNYNHCKWKLDESTWTIFNRRKFSLFGNSNKPCTWLLKWHKSIAGELTAQPSTHSWTKPGGYCIYGPQGGTVKFCTDLEVPSQGFASGH